MGNTLSKLKNSKQMYKSLFLISLVIVFLSLSSCNSTEREVVQNSVKLQSYRDEPFAQEYHVAYKISDQPADNEVRNITVDGDGKVWIATTSGVFFKEPDSREWISITRGEERGPAYDVLSVNDEVFLATWDGLYQVKNGEYKKQKGINAPVSALCANGENVYALGPKGIWKRTDENWEKQNYEIARSVRDAMVNNEGTLWVATDVGLYACENGGTILYQDTNELKSCYVQAVSTGPQNEIWTGVLGGISVRDQNKLIKNITPKEGIPSAFVNCIRQAPDGVMWVGTEVGIVRFYLDGSHSLRFSKRWLTDNSVNDICFDEEGTAWIATSNGVSAIKEKQMTLATKQDYFYSECMTKHIREPWICGNLRLTTPGDTSTWRNSDDDNDGEYTGGYLAMESFRYAVTGDEDARIKARKAFDFLRLLQTVTETDNFFARTIVPVEWTEVHDPNRTYTKHQLADAMVNDPRYKPVEKRWRKSSDGKWLWKGDTSSDEMNGHMMAYFYYYEYAADEAEKQLVRDHVSKIVDGLIRNNYNLVGIDGKHTRWGVWSPDKLNRDPDWASEKNLNSMELLTYLKFASHISGNEKYEKEYYRLIDEEGYLENAKGINSKNPAWQIYFDLTMEGYLFPILLRYETDPEIRAVYEQMLEDWMAGQKSGENLINNLAYTLCTGKKINVQQTIDFLKDTPLDLVDWHIDHTLREDVEIVRSPILEEIQIAELPPASERATVRWDKNPWAAVHGNPSQVREPVFWLWPYWEARYLGIIEE
nr:two-component regulator propeller domain-containing protein [uncultured Draconibacterium sp.]